MAYQLRGRWDAAVAAGEEALRLSETHGVGLIYDGTHRAHLSNAYLRAGELAPARRMAERAVAAADRSGPRYAPRAHLALARALLAEGRAGDRDRIAAALGAAERIVSQTGACIYASYIEAARAELSRLGA